MRTWTPLAFFWGSLLVLTSACDDGRAVTPPGSQRRADAGALLDGASPADDAAASGDDATSPGDDATAPRDDAAAGPDLQPLDGGTGLDATPGADSGAEPITLNPGTWTWVDFPGTACDDGTATGIGVNASATSSNVLIFLNGGGACWDYSTCVELDTSAHGPFGSRQFSQIVPALGLGAFSRSAANNPFRDWTFVFVPYCTGDLHSGSRVATYTSGANTAQIHHVGHTNVQAFLARLAATFTAPGKVVLSGSSAGGFGTVFNYDEMRAHWPAAEGYMIDDSGPLLGGDAIAPQLRTAWAAAWGNEQVMDSVCGSTACRTDYSRVYGALSARYPDDRLALLSSLQDQTIRSYLGLQPASFEAALLAAARDAIDPTPNVEYFFVSGSSHTMLGAPDSFTSGGVSLTTWLTRMVTDDPAWASTRP
jgi:hypothetical protein